MEVKKGSLIVAFVVLAGAFYATLTTVPLNVKATTLFVGGTGPGNYTAIQSAIDDAGSGDTVFVYGGLYVESLRIDKPLTLMGEKGSKPTITSWGSVLDLVVVSASWVNFSGFELLAMGEEDGITLESDNNYVAENDFLEFTTGGITLIGSDNNTIVKNTVTADWPGINLWRSNNNTIVDNRISAAKIGIWIAFSTNNEIMDNEMQGNGIYILGDSIEQWNTHVIDTTNTVNGKPIHYLKNATGGLVPSGAGQIILANCSDVTVRNQHISNTYSGMLLGFSSANKLTENTISNTEYGISLRYSSDNIIDNNTVMISYDGIELELSDNNIIDNNTVMNNDNGIYLDFSDYNIMVNNIVHSSRYHGIKITFSYDNTVANTVSYANGWDGIYLAFSSYNIVTNNLVHTNDDDGIFLGASNRNSLTGNAVLSNGDHGIELVGFSGYNRIYHNNIAFNVQQAFDDNDTTEWDDGYSSGGNYWGNYTGIDVFSGPNQDQPGADGIGDTPYTIQTNTQDRYPLVEPYGVIQPRPPTRLNATLSGIDMGNVTVTWTPSQDDGADLDAVIGYRVYRNTSFDPDGLGYQLLASLPNQTSEYVDVVAGEGDLNNYFYRVCAADLNNNTSCSTGQAAKFTRSLSKGPNLVSIPLIQSDETIQTVLQTLSYDNAWSYDPINQEWRSFSESKPYAQSLEYLSHAMGIWVNVTQDSNLTIAGVVPTSTTIDLQAGWNLVGFPSFDDNFTVADLKATVAVERIEGFDALAPPYFLRVMVDGDFLQAGFGYWIRVQSPVIWTVENT